MPEAKLTIRGNFPRPATDVVAGFVDAPTGPIVDAMGRRGALSTTIRGLTAKKRFSGCALTVWTVPRDNLAPYAALAYAKPGDVLVVATGGEDEVSVLGDIAIGMAKNAGIVAIVTDGLVRDLAGIDAVGIPVFARGLSPNSPFKNGPGEIGGTVAIGRVSIAAGDIIVGDQDGIVVVPREAAQATLTNLQKVYEKERTMEAAVRAGQKVPQWLAATLAGDDIVFLD